MKKKLLLLLALITMLPLSAQKILIAGSGWRDVAMLDKKTGAIVWKHALLQQEDCNDIEMTTNGDILLACKTRARLITKEKKELWRYEAINNEEINTATQLSDGSFLLAVCGKPAKLVWLDKTGKETRVQTFDTQIENIHGQLRQVFPTKQKTYLIPLMGKGEVIEMDANGKVLKRVKVVGNPFSVTVMKNGNWLVPCGDTHNLVVVDPKTEKIVKTITDGDIAGISLLFVSETVEMKNGNLLITNWNGHSKDKTQPKLVQIDSKNRMVWSFSPSDDMVRNISAVYVCK